MNHRTLAALVAVNVVLSVLLVICALTGGDQAYAQVDAAARGGDYIMLAGELSSRRQQAIYIIDQRGAQVVGFLVTSTTGKIDLIGTRDLSEIATARQPR